jgi:ectoine hydroxylase-related dioxygenase (phytanoyl-CoA dioxygenase family)
MNFMIQKESFDTSMMIKEINERGYLIIKNFFTQREIDDFEQCVVELLLLQAQKIGDYRQDALILEEKNLTNFEKFCQLYEMMEEKDKEALFQVQKLLTSSPQARLLFNEKLISLTGEILNSKRNRVLIDGPSVFVNRPNTDRLLYKWHSESHYYPKRRRFLNIWLPLFDDKSRKNGTMSFKVGSHKRDFPFSDYQGYSKDTQGKANHFTQLEIPSNLLAGFEEYWCEVGPKDLVIFHKNMVHTSNQNTSNKYSIAVVARFWDPTDDLTISGAMGVTPYSENSGRSNLIVNLLE